MGYNLTAVWCKGSTHASPDALSCHPILKLTPEDSITEISEDQTPEPWIAEVRIHQTTTADSLRLTELRHVKLKDVIFKGFPSPKGKLPESCKQYWQVWHNLTIDGDLIVYGCRLLIPHTLRRDTLKQLHELHQGTLRTKQRAHLTVYWSGIDNDIDNLISQCQQCQAHLPANPRELMISNPRPSHPFQKLAADFCYHGAQCYLIVVGCYTDWPTIAPMGKNVNAADLVTILRELFSRTAMPDLFWSDGGPQFTSKKFQSFAAQWGFKHQASLLRKGGSDHQVDEENLGMEGFWTVTSCVKHYYNTPSLRDGLSPTQKLFGRPVQDTFPAHPTSFDLQ